ncbi:O-fucosyltransferase 30-like protein, partial [Drosera capensis]
MQRASSTSNGSGRTLPNITHFHSPHLSFSSSLSSPSPLPSSSFPPFPSLPSKSPKCPRPRTLGEQFLFYAPHSGFSNQVSEFNNAIVISVALGSCPKFRVLGANEIRGKVWESAIEMLRSGSLSDFQVALLVWSARVNCDEAMK